MVKRGFVIAGSASLIGLGLAWFIKRMREQLPEGLQYTLIIDATEGGTTTPPPGTYYTNAPTMITVTAKPEAGYTFDGWFVSGDKVSTELTYAVNVDGNMLLIASFLKEGQPQLIPAYIRPVRNAIPVDWWFVWVETVNVFGRNIYYLRFHRSKLIEDYVQFRIADAAGNGVVGQQIAVYTDQNPDELDYGYVYLNGEEHTVNNPLILTSDANGVVSVRITYKWIEPVGSDYSTTLGTGAKAHWTCFVTGGWTYPIKDGERVEYPCWWDNYERVKHPISRNVNVIHAYWVDNPNLPVYGDATIDCMVKLEDKLY